MVVDDARAEGLIDQREHEQGGAGRIDKGTRARTALVKAGLMAQRVLADSSINAARASRPGSPSKVM